jgi:hypothetical protein
MGKGRTPLVSGMSIKRYEHETSMKKACWNELYLLYFRGRHGLGN